mgnify:FL=1
MIYSNNVRLQEIKEKYRLSKIEMAENEIKLYLIDYPNDDYAKSLYADILRVRGKYEEAVNIYQEILINAKSKKAIGNSYVGLAKMEMINKNYDEAKKYASMAIENDFEFSGNFLLHRIYVSNNEPYKALEVLNFKDEEINKRYNDLIRINRARVYIDVGNIDAAKKELKQINPSFNEYKKQKYYCLARIEMANSNYDKANDYIDSALNLDNRKNKLYLQLLFTKANILTKLNRGYEALTICKDIIKLSDGTKQRTYITMGDIYKSQKDEKMAYSYYSKVDDPSVIPYANLKLGALYIQKFDYEKAYEYLSKIDITQDEKIKNEVYYYLSLIEFKLGYYDKSIKLIDKVNKDFMDVREINSLNRMKVYSMVKEGIPFHRDNYTYTEKQILNYDEELAINHIFNKHVDNDFSSRFSETIDVRELFNNIGDKLDQKYKYGSYDMDLYIIPYPRIGYSPVHNKMINELEVITLPDSKQILSMFPVYYESDKGFCMEGEALDEYSNNKNKTKRLSAIEKFNKRYGKK